MISNMSRYLVGLCIIAVIPFAAEHALAWGVGHNDSSRLGATLAPEPFGPNPDMCVFAAYPDAIQDHAVGHGRDGYLRRLMTFEAIDALRAGDVPKALFFASAATHYLTDRTCIAHAGQAWYGNEEWQPLLPAKYQGVKVPFAREEVYYKHLKGYHRDTVLKLPPPEYCREIWDRTKGSTNAYFDSLPSVRKFVTSEMLRTFENWTFNDAFLYGRWYATFIALDMLDGESLNNPPLRFKDPSGMQAVCLEELINGAAVCASYYSYLVTAAATDVSADWASTLPPRDKLLELVEPGAAVIISKKAPWALERAALVLAMELLRAERRRAAVAGSKPPAATPDSFVIRYDAAKSDRRLAKGNVFVLVTPDDTELREVFGPTELAPGKRGLIATRTNPFSKDRKAVLLTGASLQDTIHLVDYLLDLAWAPIHGRWPADNVVAALQETWGGWKLIEDMRSMAGSEAVEHARKCPYRHHETRAADSKRYRELLGSELTPGAPETEWLQFFVLKTPLPDGQRASDLIATGTDYSALLSALTKNE